MIKFIFFNVKGKRRGKPSKLNEHYSQTQPFRQRVKSTRRRNVSRKLNFGNEGDIGKPEQPTNHIMSEEYNPEDR